MDASAEYEVNIGTMNICTCIERCVRMYIYLRKFAAYLKIVNCIYIRRSAQEILIFWNIRAHTKFFTRRLRKMTE